MEKRQGQWSSYWTFVLATAGAAVGLGNIWKFPYIAGENGGGAFVLVYLLCILIIGIPLMIAEVMLGRAGGGDPKTSMLRLAKKNNALPIWSYLGYMLILAGFLVLSYYSVIAGWAIAYVFKAMSGVFHHAQSEAVNAVFQALIASPSILIFWHTIVILLTVGVVSLGVEKGLERAVLYLFPAMLALLLILVGYSMSTGFFAKGVMFLFHPQFEKLTGKGFLIAVGHSFFTLSLATGSIMMYGAYLPRHISIPKTSLFIAAADTLIALLAGLAIFPIVFAHGLQPGAGPGLIFQTLPLAFGHMPYGDFIGTIFFIMLVFAAFTSAISLLEPTVAWVMKHFSCSRRRAALGSGLVIWVLGFATVFSFNIWKGITLFKMNAFELLDMLTANLMLPIGGLLIAIFAAWKFKNAREELDLRDGVLFKLWQFCLGVVTPFAIGFVFLHAMGWI
jgi:NSS family neurotransmitter:Na+ symporter